MSKHVQTGSLLSASSSSLMAILRWVRVSWLPIGVPSLFVLIT